MRLPIVQTRPDALLHVRVLSVGSGMLTDEMSRHTTLRFCLDPTVEQHKMLARHAGAARFAFNQRLAMVKTALTQRKTNPGIEVPWSGFDLINVFNGWKKAEDAGRVLAIDSTSFRLRNKHPKGAPAAIRVGDNDRPRSITLPGIGQIGVHDDTRRLRRMLARDRAKILFATVSHHAGCWWVSLTLRPPICTPPTSIRRAIRETLAGVGLDRGLSAFVVAADADGREVDRITAAPKALTAGMKRQRRLAKSLSRKQKESRNRRDAAAKLGRHHHHIANIRRYFLHQVSNELVKTHDRLVIETLNVSGMLANHRLAPAISDAGWAEFPPTELQTGLARRRTRSSGSLVPVEQAPPRLRGHPWRSDPGRSDVHLRVRTFR
jgi:putative transposase